MIKLYNMDVFAGLKQMRKENMKVDCVVTSPPYWGLRDYSVCSCSFGTSKDSPTSTLQGSIGNATPKWAKEPNPDCPFCSGTGKIHSVESDQIGMEKHPKEYVNKIVEVFDLVKDVLHEHGTVFLNLGDTYISCGKWTNKYETGQMLWGREDRRMGGRSPHRMIKSNKKWIQRKQKALIPHRIAIAMQDRGWILRNDIIWRKLNYMPSSVTDRFTNSFEYLFFFVKNQKYFFDLDAVREPHQKESVERLQRGINLFKKSGKTYTEKNKYADMTVGKLQEPFYGRSLNPNGKNPGDIISTTLKPFSGAHFAVYPPELIEKPIKVGCPEKVCRQCGKPQEKIFKKGESVHYDEGNRTIGKVIDAGLSSVFNCGSVIKRVFIGMISCGHNDYRHGIVLDPFAGSGTTAQVAREQGKDCIMIELNPRYEKIMRERLFGGCEPLSRTWEVVRKC